jgi:hypothetical protein
MGRDHLIKINVVENKKINAPGVASTLPGAFLFHKEVK